MSGSITHPIPRWSLQKIWPLAAILVLAVIAPWFLDKVASWGHRIRASDLQSDYLEAIFWAIFLGVSIAYWPIRAEDKPSVIAIWAMKSAVALGAMLPYEGHYKLDAFAYFRQSHNGIQDATTVGPGSTHVIELARLHALLLLDSYHAMKLTFAMIGLLAMYLFYRAACIYLERSDVRILWIIALVPSLMFWSSILGKDPINMFGYASYAYGVVGLCKRGKLRYLLAIALGIAAAGAIRMWTAGIMMVALWFLLFIRISMPARVLLSVFSLAAAGALYSKILAFLRVASAAAVLENLQDNAAALAKQGGSGTGQIFRISGFSDLIKYLPIVIPSTLFRPLPGEVMNPFGWLAGLEDLFMVVLAIRAIARVTKAELMDPVIAWALFLIIMWGAVYGFFGAGNLGALDRFRLQILPFMLLVLLYLGRKPREFKTA